MQNSFSCVVIGAGSLLKRCLEILVSNGGQVNFLLARDFSNDDINWCEAKGIKVVASLKDIKTLKKNSFDYLFNIGSDWLLDDEIINKPSFFSINCHDSLLPKYAGRYATIWAILNGESTHGITWHKMTTMSDGGGILLQEKINISENETAASLDLKCHEEIIVSFNKLIQNILREKIKIKKQNLKLRTYNYYWYRPHFLGVINFEKKPEELYRIVRALNFRSRTNKFCSAKIIIKQNFFIVKDIVFINKARNYYEHGIIISISKKRLIISGVEKDVGIEQLWTVGGVMLTPEDLQDYFGIQEGDKCIPLLKGVENEQRSVVEHEVGWVKELESFRHSDIPYFLPLKNTSQIKKYNFELNFFSKVGADASIPTEAERINALAVFLIYFSKLSRSNILNVVLAFKADQFSGIHSQALSKFFPFSFEIFEGESYEKLCNRLKGSIFECWERGSFFVDIFQRYNELPKFIFQKEIFPLVLDFFSEVDETSSYGEFNYISMQGEKIIFSLDYLAWQEYVLDDSVDSWKEKIKDFIKEQIFLIKTKVDDNSIQIKEININNEMDISKYYSFATSSFDSNHLIHTGILNSVEKHPHKVAIIFDGKSISYEDLNLRVKNVASYIYSEGGRFGNFIAVIMPKSIDQVIACLAISFLGATFIPINTEEPIERKKLILKQSKANLLVVEEESSDLFDVPKIIFKNYSRTKQITLNSDFEIKTKEIAYIIFTSGSTGTPKGVCISHKSVVNTILAINAKFKVSQEDSILMLSALNFDLAIYDIFGILGIGGALCIPALQEDRSPRHWLKLLVENHITIWNSVPALMQIMLDYLSGVSLDENEKKGLKSLRLILLSGDWISITLPPLIQTYFPNAKIISLGGATEASIWSNFFEINKVQPFWKRIPYGKALPNQSLLIMDSNLELCQPGVLGTLYIGGKGLAEGYLDPIQTSKQFINHPVIQERFYNTGDLARVSFDGIVDFLGRIDSQVKINGYRIELEEVESALLKCKEVSYAAVNIKKGARGFYLCAYLVKHKNSIVKKERLLEHLTAYLPYYMIPTEYFLIEKLPLNKNGKLDRGRLDIEVVQKISSNKHEEAFVFHEEIILREIWGTILKLNKDEFGVTDNFFELGGDSISAIQIASLAINYGFEFTNRDIFEFPTIQSLAKKFLKKSSEDLISSECAIDSRKTLLSSLQRGILYETEKSNLKDIYLVQVTFNITKAINLDKLKKVVELILNKHDIFRLQFYGLEPIFKKGELSVAWEVYENFSGDREMVSNILDAERKKEFSLKNAPLLKFKIFKNKKSIEFLITYHHIILDGWSLSNFLIETFSLYAGKNITTEKNEFAYFVSYVEKLKVVENNGFKKYWEKVFNGFNFESLNVKTSREAQRKDFNFLSFNFTSELYERIKVVCRNMSITQNSFFSTAFGLALRFYKNSDDFIFGTIISGRDINLKAIDKRMGMFINTIPVRFKYSTDKRLFEILKNMQSQLLESRKYGYSSLIEIGEALNHPMGNLPFFDALFIFDSYPREAITTINAISNSVKIEQFKVHEFINYPFVFSMDIDENQDVSVRTCFLDLFFSKKQMDYFYSTFISICEKMLFVNDSVTDIKIHPKESSEIEKFEKGEVKKRSELLLKDIISDVSEKFENNISVVYDKKHLTYRELLKKTEEVSSFLSSEYKLKRGDVVALHVQKSIQYVVFLLALIKQGFIYLPINFNYPLDRAKKILSNSHARLLITDHEDLDNILGLKQIKITTSRSVYLDSEKARKNYVDISIKNDETLYLIFTSGSTGEPKGVEIKNESLVNMLLFFKEKLNFLPTQSMFFLSSISFDISLLEVFLPLISGGVIHILDDEITTSPEALVKYINNNTIHYIQATPSMWEMLIAAGLKNKKGTTFLCGGEALSEHTKNKLIQISSRIFQVYGPTETTVWSTLSILSKNISSSVIGYPISNTYCYVLSDSFQRLPFGVIGELYIAGQGLALGYLNSKENIGKFLLVEIDGIFHKLYKTGDLVKRLDNGALEFLGRNDSQVKIRGYRVETKEVETVIKKYGGIENCIVNLVNHNHHQFLVAYLKNDSGFYKDNKQEGMDYSLFFFSANSTQGGDKYSLLVNSVIYADQNKFDAVWLPERHFDIVGGNYSSPSVISAYLASITKRLKLRAGSLILPLHNVFRAAEEWSIVDNLSNGRIGISFGSGWHPNDFVLSATNYLDRKNILASGIEKFIMLWSGEKLTAKNGLQQDTDVEIFPKPMQEKLPVWISISKNQEGYIYAGENNFNILTHTLEQDLEQLEKNISLYRSRLKGKKGHVTLMLHTFLDEDNEFAIKTAKEALSSYFKSHLNLLERINNLESCELNGSSPDLIDSYIDSAFSYYMKEGALIGSPKECMSKVQRLMDIGIDEIACFIDFGVDEALVFKSLPFIVELMDKTKYIRRTPNVDIEQLKKYLETRLPVYMLPSHFLTLSKFPLTPNGKTDARALEKLFFSNHTFTLNNGLEAKEINAENFVVEQLKSIWKDLLSLHFVSENENFFSLGGHSLLAMQMLTKIHDIFNKKILLSQFIVEPTISNLGKYIVECKTEDSLKIYKSQDVEYIPLSFPQQRIWYNYVLLENEPIYNDYMTYSVNGELDIHSLEIAFNLLIHRFRVLRSNFKFQKVEVCQSLSKKEIKMDFIKLSDEDLILDEMKKYIKRKFDLTNELPIRVLILKVTKKYFKLCIVIHHIAIDGWSWSVIINALSKFYEATIKNIKPELPLLEYNYYDYCLMQNTWFREGELESKKKFWINYLKFAEDKEKCLVKFNFDMKKEFSGGEYCFKLDEAIVEKVDNIAVELSTTRFVILLSIFHVVLSRISSKKIIVTTVPFSNRIISSTERMVGMFVNMLPIFSDFSEDIPYYEYIKELSFRIFKCFENQDYPIEKLFSFIGENSERNRHEFNIAFALHNIPSGLSLPLNKCEVVREHLSIDISRFDLSMIFEEHNSELIGRLEYSCALFQLEDVKNLVDDYIEVLPTLLTNNSILMGSVLNIVTKPTKNINTNSSLEKKVEGWKVLYNELYEENYKSGSKGSKIIGWNSSYTGLPMMKKEIDEWLTFTINRILSLKPRKILEIGCGTGLIIDKVLPHVENYFATDVSGVVINILKKKYSKNEKIGFLNQPAHIFDGLSNKKFDVIVINSVIQYFPSIEYFENVLKTLLGILNDNGVIYCGDIRNFDYLKDFHLSINLYKSSGEIDESLFSDVMRACNQDRELLISPSYFVKFSETYQCKVFLEPKIGLYDNELTRYRYDIVLKKNASLLNRPKGIIEVNSNNLDSLISAIKNRPNGFFIRIDKIVNKHLLQDIDIYNELFFDEDGIHFDPENFFNYNEVNSIAEKHNLKLHLHFSEIKYNYVGIITEKKIDYYSYAPLVFTYEHGKQYANLLGEIVKLPNPLVSSSDENTLKKDYFRKIWQDILHVNYVQDVDDFFSLGGDSIASIYLVSRLSQEGLDIDIKLIRESKSFNDFFESILTLKKEKSRASHVQIPVSKNFSAQLLPAQAWFFKKRFQNPGFWNQGFLFNVLDNINESDLKTSILAVMNEQEVFHCRFKEIEGAWSQQKVKKIEDNLHFEMVDHYLNDSKLKSRMLECQSNAKLSEKLVKVIYFKGNKLVFIAIHHLLVDLYSWYFLINAIEKKYFFIKKVGEKFSVEDKAGCHYFDLLDYISIVLNNKKLLFQETAFWRIENDKNLTSFKNFSFGKVIEQTSLNFEISLDDCNIDGLDRKLYLRDILALSISLAYLKDDLNEKEIVIDIEHHGRVEFHNIPLRDTVGWVTSIYPFTYSSDLKITLKENLIKIADKINKFSNKSFFYSVGKYLGEDASLMNNGAVLLNYFGINSFLNSSKGLLEMSDASLGFYRDPNSLRPYLYEVNSFIKNNKLFLELSFNRHYEKNAVEFFYRLKKMVSSFLSKDLNKKTFLPALRVISYQDKDKTPIIFMPPIGGQIYWYFELINKMELKKTCYAFESPGLYGDTTLENIEQVVQFYLEQIRLLDIKKCIIIGWSFGASLAYELSKCIENHSEISVVASILIDPEYVKNKKNGISNLLTELYESKDLRFNLKPSEINEMLLKNKVEDVLKNIDIFSSDENVKRLVKNTIRVYLKNISNLINYTPSGKIKNIYLIEAAFFADEETLIAEEEKFWGDFCDKMSYHKIIGDHYSIINGKDMSKLLTILKNILRDSF